MNDKRVHALHRALAAAAHETRPPADGDPEHALHSVVVPALYGGPIRIPGENPWLTVEELLELCERSFALEELGRILPETVQSAERDMKRKSER